MERGRGNDSFTVEEGNEVKDRVLETVGFQGANQICDGRGGQYIYIRLKIISLNCSNAGTRTPIAGARNQCPTVRRHSIYIVYYTLYIARIQGVNLYFLRDIA